MQQHFLHEYIHEKGEEQSLPYCNKTCYVNRWMGRDCETLCMLNAKIWRGVGLQAPGAREPSPASSVQCQLLKREEVS